MCSLLAHAHNTMEVTRSAEYIGADLGQDIVRDQLVEVIKNMEGRIQDIRFHGGSRSAWI